jgi:hypothetical protein
VPCSAQRGVDGGIAVDERAVAAFDAGEVVDAGKVRGILIFEVVPFRPSSDRPTCSSVNKSILSAVRSESAQAR